MLCQQLRTPAMLYQIISDMFYIVLGIIVIALDQFTKYLVRGMASGDVIHVIGDFLRIVHVENSGAAFGLFEGSRRFLLLFPAIIIVGAIYFISRDMGSDLKGKLSRTALTLIASGGIGNMIDRFLFGHVTDMISFSIFPPVFNVADIAVTCGCGLLVFCLVYFGSDEKKDAAGGTPAAGSGVSAEDAGTPAAGADVNTEGDVAPGAGAGVSAEDAGTPDGGGED